MSWLYSQALVAAYSAASSSAGVPSALSSGNPTQQAFLPPDRTTDFSRPSQYGMTFKPLTDALGTDVLTWFLEAFPARTSALPAPELELMESGLACGPTWRASLARFDPASSMWKTAQLSLLGDSTGSSVTWPRSGMTAAGQCWELTLSAPTIVARDSGLLPTLTANDCKPAGRVEVLEYRQPKRRTTVMRLRAAVTEPHQIGLPVNPTWAEWFMGWPLGWTDLRPWETGKSPNAPPLPGDCSQEPAHENQEFHTTIRG
jgi:hypothetical protein